MSVRYSDTLVVGASGVPTTTGALTVYVDAAGSDTTGKGTAALPYATVERAYADIPGIIRHECKILVGAGNYADGWPTSIAPIFEGDGSLAIVGVGVPDVVSGAHSVTGVALLGAGGQRITVGAGGLGAVDSLCGQTMMIATGGTPGYAYHVAANTDTTIDVVIQATPVVNADTFNLVVPAAKIASDGFYLKYDSRGVGTWDGGGFLMKNSRLILHNIWLDMSGAPTPVDTLQIEGTQPRGGPGFKFVRIDLPATVYGSMVLRDTAINGETVVAFSDDYATDGGTGIDNLFGFEEIGLAITNTAARDSLMIYAYGNVYIGHAEIKGTLKIYRGNVAVGRAAIGMFEAGTGAGFRGSTLLAEGKAGSACMMFGLCDASLQSTYISKGTNAVVLKSGARLELEDNVECDPINITAYAMRADVCTVRHRGALANFVGASGAYELDAPTVSVTGAIWMAVDGTGSTDGVGSFITRHD